MNKVGEVAKKRRKGDVMKSVFFEHIWLQKMITHA